MTGIKIRFEVDTKQYNRAMKRAADRAKSTEVKIHKMARTFRQDLPPAIRRARIEVEKFDRTLRKLDMKAQGMMKAFTGMSVSIRKFINPVSLAAAGIGALGLAASRAVRHLQGVNEAMREITQRSRQFGVSRPDLGGVVQGLGRRGISASSAIDSIQTMRERIQDALEGQSTAVDVFRRLNLDPNKIKDMGATEQLERIGRAFRTLSEHQKALTATDLFGDEGAKIAGAFESSAEFMKQMERSAENISAKLLTEKALTPFSRMVGDFKELAESRAFQLILGTGADQLMRRSGEGGSAVAAGRGLAGIAGGGLARSIFGNAAVDQFNFVTGIGRARAERASALESMDADQERAVERRQRRIRAEMEQLDQTRRADRAARQRDQAMAMRRDLFSGVNPGGLVDSPLFQQGDVDQHGNRQRHRVSRLPGAMLDATDSGLFQLPGFAGQLDRVTAMATAQQAMQRASNQMGVNAGLRGIGGIFGNLSNAAGAIGGNLGGMLRGGGARTPTAGEITALGGREGGFNALRQSEVAVRQQEQQQRQTDLLSQIEQNTRAGNAGQGVGNAASGIAQSARTVSGAMSSLWKMVW